MRVNKVSRDPGSLWSVTHAPAANTRAMASKAGAPGQRHVCTGILARIVGGILPPVAANPMLHLRDGTTGVGTALASLTMAIPAVAAGRDELVVVGGLDIPGTVGNAMTLEFSAAGGLNTFQSVTLTGYTIR